MAASLIVDTEFDARSDTPEGKDPDSWSPTLLRHHRLLWGRPFPDGTPFPLVEVRRGVLEHRSDLGRFLLTSDTIATSHRRRLPRLYEAAGPASNAEFHRLGSTIGGFIVFPGDRIDRRWTINQSRGMHGAIADRWDLTLEAIRRHYAGATSPLSATLARYTTYFDVFGSFDGYVAHFLLHDMVGEGCVRFTAAFDDFRGPALPDTLDAYRGHRSRQLDLVRQRNARIAALTSRSD